MLCHYNSKYATVFSFTQSSEWTLLIVIQTNKLLCCSSLPEIASVLEALLFFNKISTQISGTVKWKQVTETGLMIMFYSISKPTTVVSHNGKIPYRSFMCPTCTICGWAESVLVDVFQIECQTLPCCCNTLWITEISFYCRLSSIEKGPGTTVS